MPSLIWTPQALADLRRLSAFLDERNPAAARRAVRAVREGVRMIATHPEAGRPARQMEDGYRERSIPFGGSGYIVLYRREGSRILLLAVRHQLEAGYSE